MCVCVVFGEACYVKIFSLRPYWGGVSCPCVSGGRRGLNTTLVYRLLSQCVREGTRVIEWVGWVEFR